MEITRNSATISPVRDIYYTKKVFKKKILPNQNSFDEADIEMDGPANDETMCQDYKTITRKSVLDPKSILGSIKSSKSGKSSKNTSSTRARMKTFDEEAQQT